MSPRRILAPHRGGWEYLRYFHEKLNLWHPPSNLWEVQRPPGTGHSCQTIEKGIQRNWCKQARRVWVNKVSEDSSFFHLSPPFADSPQPCHLREWCADASSVLRNNKYLRGGLFSSPTRAIPRVSVCFPAWLISCFAAEAREHLVASKCQKLHLWGLEKGVGRVTDFPGSPGPLCLPGKTPPDLLASGADARRFTALLNLPACILTSAFPGSLRPKGHAPDCVTGWHLSHCGVGWHPGSPSSSHTARGGCDWEPRQPEVCYPPQCWDARLPALGQWWLTSQRRRE